VASSRNVPLRLALAAAGFRAGEREPGVPGDAATTYQRDLGGPPPGLPAWVTAPGEPEGRAR
jgi:hypothetical protein